MTGIMACFLFAQEIKNVTNCYIILHILYGSDEDETRAKRDRILFNDTQKTQDRSCKQRENFKENKNKKDNYTQNQKEEPSRTYIEKRQDG